MSYYELTNYLESIYDVEPNNELVDNLNNLDVYLDGDRYFRFVDHFRNLITYRLNKIVKPFDNIKDGLTLEKTLDGFVKEITFVIHILQSKLISKETTLLLIKDISVFNNDELDIIKTKYNSMINETLLNKINESYREEEIEEKEEVITEEKEA